MSDEVKALSKEELAKLSSRHINTDFNFPEIREVKIDSANALLQMVHRDRRDLLATIAERDAQIAALTTERDDARTDAACSGQDADNFLSRATSAEATCARLREALEPFTYQYPSFAGMPHHYRVIENIGGNITVGDLRRAASALTQADGERG